MDNRELLIDWLKNAHAVEMNAAKSMEGFAPDFEDLPEAHSRILQHIEETKDQADELEAVLNDLGADNSKLKDVSGKVMGFISGKTNPLADDKLVKHAIMMHSMESMEYATYVAIERLALNIDEKNIADMAGSFIEDEKEMAEWVERQIPVLVDNLTTQEED